jgi:hypothetical protein
LLPLSILLMLFVVTRRPEMDSILDLNHSTLDSGADEENVTTTSTP